MPDLYIEVTNTSSDVWTIPTGMWVCGAGDDPHVNWTDRVTEAPSPSLSGQYSQTVASAETEHLGSIVDDALYMTLGYKSETTSDTFALSIMRRFHMIGIGKGDVWRTWENNEWSAWTENTGPKTWQFNTYTVTATPVLSNSSASVQVVISPTTGS